MTYFPDYLNCGTHYILELLNDKFLKYLHFFIEPFMTIERLNRLFQVEEKEREAVKWGWEQEM